MNSDQELLARVVDALADIGCCLARRGDIAEPVLLALMRETPNPEIAPESAGQVAAEPEPEQAEKPKSAARVKQPTLAAVRVAVSKVVAFDTERGRKLITEIGGTSRLSDVDVAKYGDIIAAAKTVKEELEAVDAA